MDEYCQHESLSKECMKRENSSEKKIQIVKRILWWIHGQNSLINDKVTHNMKD